MIVLFFSSFAAPCPRRWSRPVRRRVFLDTLEPYVLVGKLKTLSPEVVAAFVDRCQVRQVDPVICRSIRRSVPPSRCLASPPWSDCRGGRWSDKLTAGRRAGRQADESGSDARGDARMPPPWWR